MMKPKYIIATLICFQAVIGKAQGQPNYLDYHKEVIKCEQLIVEYKFKEAIRNFEVLFNRFDFVFLRDIRLATQLSIHEQAHESAYNFMRLGLARGWSLKGIKKKGFLDPLDIELKERLESEEDVLHQQYLSGLNQAIRLEVREMLKKDQRKAFGALLRIGQKSQDKYAEKKFAPHSVKQLDRLNHLLDQYGYPGERLIGNNWWVSVILSHHNSISKDYNSKDTLFLNMRPKLIRAIERGELHPYAFSIIEDWRTASLNNHDLSSYGFLGKVTNAAVLVSINENRDKIGLRSIELRNKLIDIENETGMNFFLPKDWQKDKITVTNK